MQNQDPKHGRTRPAFQVGDQVRIRPTNGLRHFGRGIITEVQGEHALVLPYQRHRHTERIPLNLLRIWKSANAIQQQRMDARREA